MWSGLAAISFFVGFLAPPVWAFTIFCIWQQNASDRNNMRVARARGSTPPMATSHPGDCPQCGGMSWARSALRTIPAISVRRASWITGNAASTTFKCVECGGFGRYARSYDQPEQGWILLDRWAGGW